MKFTNLIVKRDGILIDNSIDNWLDLTPNGLLYLYYTVGRVYLSVTDESIRYMCFNDEYKTFSFRFIGFRWEDDAIGDREVNSIYEVTFNNLTDYTNTINIINSFGL